MTGDDEYTVDAEYTVDPELAGRIRDNLVTVSAPAAEEEVAAAREVGEVLRQVIDRLTATAAPPDVLREVVARLARVEDLLRPQRAVRYYHRLSEDSGLGPDRAFEWSPLLGLANPIAPPVRVAVEDGRVVGRARFGISYEGPPGCVHGGLIAAAFDEVLRLTQLLSGRPGMTGTLTVKYRRPTPLHTELRLEGRVVSVVGRKVTTHATMRAGEELTAEATGLFISVEPDALRALAGQREAQPETPPAGDQPGAP